MTAISENVSLRSFNTFGIDVRARYFTEIHSEAELTTLIHSAPWKNHTRLILGGGSNILFTRDFEGLVVRCCIPGRTIVHEDAEKVLLKVGSGENWHQLVMYCLHHGWGGIENLSLIPGTAGAAPIQNIGAYGVEIKDVLEWVDGIQLNDHVTRRLHTAECQFGYRESVFKHQLREFFFISSITLRLTKKNHVLHTEYGAIKDILTRNKIETPTIRDVSDAVIEIRRSKLPDPMLLGNAGSFFKNPAVTNEVLEHLRATHPTIPCYPFDNQHFKIAAGWLIEQCGWKGRRIGNIGVHPHQALVLVNYGGGKGDEILKLAEQIQRDVFEKFRVNLTTEVNIF